ncbi:YkvI family membrane protein [Alkalibacillus almallahensis]|uniref:YkvI family membrane protein n=1 Tax=Alkalibacillus almallahensis TaxID=1379154 RepID=UPI001421C53D|nr:hypothetical protein [Alkalibacillus almallahensis]NIK13296.1 putative membrane protein YkvI [Alkalibacillus almallahensis]
MQKLLEGKFGRFILPGIILQSVLIGGGFATGREIVEFGAAFGSMGWMAGIAIFLGFTIASILTFEFARKFKTYNYRHFLKELIGPLWFLFDIVYIFLAILIISIMASATGEILQNTLNLNYWVGVGFIIVIVGALNFYGKGVIERFKTFGTLSLMLGYLLFAILVISTTWDEAVATLQAGDTSFAGSDIAVGTVIWTGLLYVGYNLAVYPATLFSIERQTSRKESVVAGLVAGVLMTVPWFLIYFSLLGHYPDSDVFDASVPWLVMLDGFPVIVVILFGVVVGWTLVETSSGMIHAFVDRVDTQLQEVSNKALSQVQKGIIAVGALVLALVLAQVGIIDLIATGYTAMAYAMIAVFMLPLLTIGVYKIFIKK